MTSTSLQIRRTTISFQNLFDDLQYFIFHPIVIIKYPKRTGMPQNAKMHFEKRVSARAGLVSPTLRTHLKVIKPKDAYANNTACVDFEPKYAVGYSNRKRLLAAQMPSRKVRIFVRSNVSIVSPDGLVEISMIILIWCA